jgi:hypothetical protein
MMLGIGKIEEMLVMLITLVVTVFEIAMIVHVLRNRQGSLAKLLWTIAIIVFPVLGALYYFYWASVYRRRS